MRTEVYFGPYTERQYEVLKGCKEYIEEHGLDMFTYNQVKQTNRLLSSQMQRESMNCRDVSRRLDLSKEWDVIEKDVRMAGHKRRMEEWQTYWTPEKFHEIAREILEKYRCIPVSGFLAVNGYGHFCQKVNKYAGSFAKLREQYDSGYKSRLRSVDLQRWLSFAECCFANYLISRGVTPVAGKPYPEAYIKQSGRSSGRYDMHFLATRGPEAGKEINVEIWGGTKVSVSGRERYEETKRHKVLFHINDPCFIQAEYQACYLEGELSNILQPYIHTEVIVKHLDGFPDLPCTKWSLVEQVTHEARNICNKIPGGILPPRSWFCRDGIYVQRVAHKWEPLPHVLSALGWRINEVGFDATRAAIGQGQHNARKWTKIDILKEFADIYQTYGKSPMAVGKDASVSFDVKRRCNTVSAAARKLKVVNEICQELNVPLRRPRQEPWKYEDILKEYKDILEQHRKAPTQFTRSHDNQLRQRCARVMHAAKKLNVVKRVHSELGISYKENFM